MRSTQHRDVAPVVAEPTSEVAPRLAWWSRLLDGAHPWGSFDATVGRYGVQRFRLIIYPGGISTAGRRLVRLWRGWPVGGGALGLLGVMLLGNVVSSPNAVLAVALVAYVSVGALLFLLAGPARLRVRSMSAIVMPHNADARELCRYAEWQTLVAMLIRADQMLSTGAISPVEHEAIWWDAYDRLEETARV